MNRLDAIGVDLAVREMPRKPFLQKYQNLVPLDRMSSGQQAASIKVLERPSVKLFSWLTDVLILWKAVLWFK